MVNGKAMTHGPLKNRRLQVPQESQYIWRCWGEKRPQRRIVADSRTNEVLGCWEQDAVQRRAQVGSRGDVVKYPRTALTVGKHQSSLIDMRCLAPAR